MKKRARLIWQVFVSILAVTLMSVLATGLIARYALESQFERYVDGLGQPMGGGRGMGRMMLGSAEQSFLAGVDRGIVVSAVVAIAIAAVAALLLARYLTRPLAALTAGAKGFAGGDLQRRVDVDGPAEVVELAEAFNEMAGSLSEAEVLRRRMVADVAHELRNPIASLRAQTEGVADGVLVLDEARARSLVDDVTHLTRLVEDLQELSVAEAGKLRYDPASFDLADLVDRELDRARAQAAGGVELRRVGQPVTVVADEYRIGQVMRNLVSNAVRHTTHGSVEVSLDVQTGERGDRVRVEVRDTGEGIPEQDLPYVFERFYRADTSRTADTGGAGIGLAIARRIVEDHGGTVFASSDQGVLTVVGFVLPLVSLQSHEPSG